MYRNLAFGRELDSLDVVIVDENRGMRSLLTTILKANGVTRMRAYGDSNRALNDMVAMTPDVAIVQWNMTQTDPVTLLRSMRTEAMRPLCFVPVVVLSSLVSKSVVADAVYAGASTVLATPISPKTLLDRLRWITQDLRCFYEDQGRYVLQSHGKVGHTAPEDADFGLFDLKVVSGS